MKVQVDVDPDQTSRNGLILVCSYKTYYGILIVIKNCPYRVMKKAAFAYAITRGVDQLGHWALVVIHHL